MLKEAKRLYDLGFGIHWLKPNSKAPLKTKWNAPEREEWSQLEKEYKPTYGLGVKMGAASFLGDGYLANIDVDVKSKDLKHLEEVYAKLDSLFPRVRETAPWITTGYGFRYLVITKQPVVSKKLAGSGDIVKVFMPTAENNKQQQRAVEMGRLTNEELIEGYRVRGAWEIEFMSIGKQVVLPPTIHPDTREPYTWGRLVLQASDIPMIDTSHLKAIRDSGGKAREDLPPFQAVKFDLIGSSIASRVVDRIIQGVGVEDRSAALLGVCIILVREKLTDNEILSVLTDRNYFLGEVAYEHAGHTIDRRIAAEWLARYTLPRAKEIASGKQAFESEVEVGRPVLLEDFAADAQKKELIETEDYWLSKLDRFSPEAGSRPRPSFRNACLILENALGIPAFYYDEFKCRHNNALDTDWGGKKDGEVTNEDVLKIRYWLAENYRIDLGKDLINDAVNKVAYCDKRHAVREHLHSLVWDGIPRLDTWLKKYGKAEGDEAYISAVGRKVICAMVARILKPGIKFDHIMVLEGAQGIQKSTLVGIIGYKDRDWMTDTYLSIEDKDAVLNIQGNWVIELGELSGVAKADVESLKAFITRQTDRIRPPFDRRPQDFPRQCVLVGTTNVSDFNKDESGGRRYWPIYIGSDEDDPSTHCDTDGLLKIRDQLFAEAVFAWQILGEKIYLDDPLIARTSRDEIQSRTPEDEITPVLQLFFAKDEKGKELAAQTFTMAELYQILSSGFSEPGFKVLAELKFDKAGQYRLSNALHRCGFKRHKTSRGGIKGIGIWKKLKSHINDLSESKDR